MASSVARRRRYEPWLVVLAGLLTGVLALALLHVVNKLALGDRVMFALDGEANVPTWFSSTIFAVAGISALGFAVLDARSRWLWLVVGVLFLAFSLDDAVAIHETTEREGESLSRLVLQPAVVVVVGYALVVLGRRQRDPERTLLLLAAATLVVALGASLFNEYLDPPYAILVSVQMIEETSEMIVPSLVIAALVSALWRVFEGSFSDVRSRV